jgi:hypothetical protein
MDFEAHLALIIRLRCKPPVLALNARGVRFFMDIGLS